MKVLRQTSSASPTIIRNNDHIPIVLTNRQKQILQLICQEFSNQEIAARLCISTRTVEGHRNNLLLTIGCKNTAGLVIFAIRYGIFELMS